MGQDRRWGQEGTAQTFFLGGFALEACWGVCKGGGRPVPRNRARRERGRSRPQGIGLATSGDERQVHSPIFLSGVTPIAWTGLSAVNESFVFTGVAPFPSAHHRRRSE